MALNAKSLGLAGGILWGVGLLILTLVSVWTGYGTAMLNGIASIYPGYSIGYLGAVVGLIYGFVDAFIGLYVFGWLYNKLE
ncbi:bacteriophage holin [Candidatus Woesearchaeota archaeon]|jgi:hypothetical protein|nr:bacteriophage holin [Candidatus Woesearchaeota archaeon]MBT5271794.1 bacteriophage holin [Candidatus Woesearchaeota archaeon]MBT6040863.1 bacteriophage holin [Candidatus Woesearchaeota archaeon]MBT6336448.1 bacteriophage holin [Candidatus Woesearchaeota archaeon]MBT7926772.1 bacteriophage holin [Candidatus Woesearchaeota archaeon]